MTAGFLLMLSGDNKDEVMDGLRTLRVCIEGARGCLGLVGLMRLSSILEVSSRFDLGGSFPSFRSYKLVDDSTVERWAWRSALLLILFRLEPMPPLSSVRRVLWLASLCTVTGAIVGSTAIELGAFPEKL
jgi:hypothetical protein